MGEGVSVGAGETQTRALVCFLAACLWPFKRRRLGFSAAGCHFPLLHPILPCPAQPTQSPLVCSHSRGRPMELPSQQMSMLPFWLQRTAERAQSQAPVADHISVRRETCHVETQDGFKVLKCSEIREVFRCAADGCVLVVSAQQKRAFQTQF
jgi:hypothetical protein